jgi:hypothetical protein
VGEVFGVESLKRTLRGCAGATAAGAVRALQDAVLGFSPAWHAGGRRLEPG